MIPFPVILALNLPDYPTLAESLQYQLTGFLVVVFTLGSLAFLVGLIGRIFATLDARRAPASAAAPTLRAAQAPPAASSEEEIPSAVLAAIAGAVTAALGDSRFAIRGVKVADPRQNLAWSAEGRRTIYASHNVR
jgi:Na+-transporting methylmalonyl-CoA/oxaloacetate decarboxylase gamma subunit